jgi:hypothetical protein
MSRNDHAAHTIIVDKDQNTIKQSLATTPDGAEPWAHEPRTNRSSIHTTKDSPRDTEQFASLYENHTEQARHETRWNTTN